MFSEELKYVRTGAVNLEFWQNWVETWTPTVMATMVRFATFYNG
jgi:hypothetical protein